MANPPHYFPPEDVEPVLNSVSTYTRNGWHRAAVKVIPEKYNRNHTAIEIRTGSGFEKTTIFLDSTQRKTLIEALLAEQEKFD